MKRLLTVCLLVLLAPSATRAEDPPVLILSWGGLGSGPGQFQFPVGLGLTPDGDVSVVDATLDRVTRFSPTGTPRCSVGGTGSGAGQFHGCIDVAYAPGGLAFVNDEGNKRFEVFDPDCGYVRQWPNPPLVSFIYVATSPVNGHVYTTERNVVYEYDSTGTYVGQWPCLGYEPMGTVGPFGVGPSGKLYFCDLNNDQVRVFSPAGVFLSAWGSEGSTMGKLFAPTALAVDAQENVYVADGANRQARFQKFTSAGTFLSGWTVTRGSLPGQIDAVSDLCADAVGNVYVLDRGNARVLKFGPAVTPAVRATWGRLKQRFRGH